METNIVHHRGGAATFTIKTKTVEDFMKIYSALSTDLDPEPKGASVEKPKRHYKKQHAKKCVLCGKKFKGNIGLGLHRVRVHEHRNWNKDGSPKRPNVLSKIIPVVEATV